MSKVEILNALISLTESSKLLRSSTTPFYHSDVLVESVVECKYVFQDLNVFCSAVYELVKDVEEEGVKNAFLAFDRSRVALEAFGERVDGVDVLEAINNEKEVYETFTTFSEEIEQLLIEFVKDFEGVDIEDRIDMARKLKLKSGWVHAVVADQIAAVRNALVDFVGEEIHECNVFPSPGKTSVSKLWISGVLKGKGVISEDSIVTNAEMLGMDNRVISGPGSMNKISVSVSNGDETSQLIFVLKMSYPSVISNRNNTAGIFREGIFLVSELASSMPCLPEIYFSYGSSLLGEFVILMEDLGLKNGVVVNNLVGNQPWGNAKMDDDQRVVDILKKVFLKTSETHARHWNDKSVLDIAWLRGAGWYKGYNRVSYELSLARNKADWVMAKDKFQIDERLVAILDKSFEITSWEALQAHIQNEENVFTLCHGDFHSQNMFLINQNDNDNEEIVMFDLAEIGVCEPTQDLAQIFISDVDPKIMKNYGSEILKAYWESLQSFGIPGSYTFEKCLQDFTRGVERWLYLFCLLANYGVPDMVVTYFQDQILGFIDAFPSNEDGYTLKSIVHWY